MRAALVLATTLVSCSAGDDLPAPLISSITPRDGISGAPITIEGDYLCQQQETGELEDPLGCENVGSVSFDQTPANVGFYSEMMVTTDVPGLPPGTYRVVISVAGRHSNGVPFTIDAL